MDDTAHTNATTPQSPESLALTAEDVATLLELTWEKFPVPANPSGHHWQLEFTLERPNQQAVQLGRHGLGPQPGPFLVAFRGPAPGLGDGTLVRSHGAPFAYSMRIPNPAADLRAVRRPDLGGGRSVVMLWANAGQHGWELGDLDFVQRIVVALFE